MIGPIVRGEPSVLDHDLTHATSGLSLYPAFDAGWTEGDVVIAPEDVTVTRHSGGSSAGWSIYLDGKSGLRYYVTHLRFARTSVGSRVAKGGRLGAVGNFAGARVPHAHVGINAERLLGAGKQLKHNTNYTHGQPTVGAQLPQLSAPAPQEVEIIEAWVPAFVDWYLFGRPNGKPRPASAPRQIPQRVWDVIDSASRYRAEKPDNSSTALSTAQAKLAQIKAIAS